MTLWRIKRIEHAPVGVATIDCLEGQNPTQVTLEDKDTGETAYTQVCVDPTDDICHLLEALAITYNPNDWAEECPS